MNYTIGVKEVDLAALLIALGYDCTDYIITTMIDLNNDTPQKREKTATYTFSDYSKGCSDYGSARSVLENYKLPKKGKPCNIIEAAKLSAHNYQVLKSVILHGEPLQQIEGVDYYMLKNANGMNIIKDNHSDYYKSSNLASIAIGAAIGCKIISYSLENGILTVSMTRSKEGITVNEIDQLLNNDSDDNESDYNMLSVLVATFINREYLIKGIYAKQQVMLIRGSKRAYFSPNADNELKQRILKELNT